MPSLEEETESELAALVGSTVAGKYRIDRLIGRGGMGAVFQAANVVIGKRVALKFLDREAAQNREACSRFQREAEAASLAESAHIVQIFDSGITEGGLPFLVMELLTGEDLRARLEREGRLTVAAALGVVSQVLRGLARAHEAGIVHRDLKPDNVFLCARDDEPSFVKIVDFGISKVARVRHADTLTRRGTVLGTAFYMSPEQAQSFPDIDGRTDLFSLGAILFEMLGGKPPHGGRTYEAVLIAICTHDAPDVRTLAPEVPASVAELVGRALQRERALRFQSAAEFLAAIATLNLPLTDASPKVSAPFPRSTGNSVTLPLRRKRYGTLIASVVATLAGFGLTAYLIARSGASSNASQHVPSPASSGLDAAIAATPIATVPAPSASSTTNIEPVPAASQWSTPKLHHPAKPKPATHVLSGLQLSTKEP
ncbi:MAG: serine/threonine-protein kinase [Pseudomonadota bacterium]